MLFLVGANDTFTEESTHKLKEEQETYNDLIQADELIESYNNLTLKTLYTLKFFLEKGLWAVTTIVISIILMDIYIYD